jgi:hypothetical protein
MFCDIFESIFNKLYADTPEKAHESFLTGYYSNPQNAEFIHGVIASGLMCGRYNEVFQFLKNEKEVSIMRNKCRLIYDFINSNKSFSTLSRSSQILNIGLLLKKHALYDESGIYFTVCLIIDPQNVRALTANGECALKKNDFPSGMKLIASAAKINASRIS